MCKNVVECEVISLVIFFFFKHKTAYEMLRSLVGSEMCIRDRSDTERRDMYACDVTYATNNELGFDYLRDNMKYHFCLLYKSDAADDLLCVDLGGRSIIKKKQTSILLQFISDTYLY